MPPESPDFAVVPGRHLEWMVACGAALVVAAFWTAPLMGLPVVATAILASLFFALSTLVLLRGLRGRRRRRAAVADAIRALAESEARYRLLADHAADMIVETDLDMRRRFVSPSSRVLLGYAPEELIDKRAVDFIHPEDLAGYLTALASLLDGTRERVVMTQRYRRRDGAYTWTEANAQVIRDPVTGRPSGYVGSLRDIAARHAAETALRDSEAFLRSVIDSTPDCIRVLDLDGRITFVSRNGLELSDAAGQAGGVGDDFRTIWPAEIRPEAASALAAAASGAVARFVARILSDGGRIMQFDVLVAPILETMGRSERLLVVTRNITAAVEADAALRESQERYRVLAENSSDIVLLRAPGPMGAVLYASPSCRRVLGYAPEDLLGADASDLFHPDDADRVAALVADLGPTSGIVLDTHRLRHAAGTDIWVETAFQRAEWGGGTVVVAASRDVAERQRRAADLAAAKDMAERAQKVAEDANLAKSDFLAVMSHEIRTPLNSILGFTDLMLDASDLPLANRRQAELIRAAGSALLTIVNDILDFSKIEAGAVELEAIVFDPAALARQCAAILGGYAGTKALDIAVEIADPSPAVLVGDEARLRQILLNLLNNAVKFTHRGGVVLRVAAVGDTPAGQTLRFEVEDTGIGIADAQRHRLFERFSQVDTSVARRFGGSGLGLAICKKLVGLMGGDIGVTSREGEGSTFWFTVTLPVAGVSAAVPLPGPRRAARILVAEDLDINRRLVMALLEAAGHAALVVADGAAAVAAAAAEHFDLVLMDVRMPGMDGVTATQRIRASGGAHAEVPIVAMTANVYPEQIEACRRAGMDDHVGKPLNRNQLYAVIDRWIGPSGPVPADPPPERESVLRADPAAAFDATVYAQLRAFLGAARLDDVLARFAASLPQHFEPGEETAERLLRWKADAHVVVSVAGMVGLAALAERCRVLERSDPGSDGYADRLAAARVARDEALPLLADLRRTLAAPAAPDSTAA